MDSKILFVVLLGTGVLFTGTAYATVQNFDDHITIPPTLRVHLDGSTTGDTYFREANPDQLRYVVGGSTAFDLNANTSPRLLLVGQAWSLGVFSGDRVHLDGGGDTYFREASPDQLRYVVGGTSALDMDANLNPKLILVGTGWSLGVQPTSKIFLDGGGDTFIQESSANNIRIVVGGVTKATISSGDICIGSC